MPAVKPSSSQSPIPNPQSLAPPAKEASRIAGMFDAIAARYDFLNHLLSAGLDKQWRKRAVEALQLTGRETVLDLCAGTADLALAAAAGERPREARHRHRFFRRDAADRQSERSTATPCSGRIDLIRGDATEIPLGDASVDAVTIGFGIRNVEDPARACREIVRVLRPGGTLVILEFSLPRSAALRRFYLWYFKSVLPRIGRLVSRHPSAYTYLPESVQAFPSPEEFSQQLRAAGFGTVRATPVTFGVVYMFVAVERPRNRPGCYNPVNH